MNALTQAGVETADRPFSTLNPDHPAPAAARQGDGDAGRHGRLYRSLPHMLVEAFKATLEEVRTADLLLHVVDASSPLAAERMEIVDRVLEEIGAGAASRIVVMNKIDPVPATECGSRPHPTRSRYRRCGAGGWTNCSGRWRDGSVPGARK